MEILLILFPLALLGAAYGEGDVTDASAAALAESGIHAPDSPDAAAAEDTDGRLPAGGPFDADPVEPSAPGAGRAADEAEPEPAEVHAPGPPALTVEAGTEGDPFDGDPAEPPAAARWPLGAGHGSGGGGSAGGGSGGSADPEPEPDRVHAPGPPALTVENRQDGDRLEITYEGPDALSVSFRDSPAGAVLCIGGEPALVLPGVSGALPPGAVSLVRREV